MPPIGIYIHVPFCLSKCPYCDFYSVRYGERLADAYERSLLRAMETQPFGGLRADTLYFGGGTPCLLGAGRLSRLLEKARDCLGLLEGAEITLEANPGAVSASALKRLGTAGFNRISFGVQSAVDAELGALGRIHNAAQAEEAILAAKDAGFTRISADLMLAIPGQTGESLRETVDFLAQLPVDHLSAYLLKIEEGTPFHKQKTALPDEDRTAELYLECVSLLSQHGFAQYEISNFCRDGALSCHNLKYWRCGEYLGLGPAAHSFLGGRRFYFPPDLQAFLSAEQPFGLAVQDGEGGGLEEAVLLGLRLSEGIDTGLLRERFGADCSALLRRALAPDLAGLVRAEGERVSLTPEGFLLSNTIILKLLEQIPQLLGQVSGGAGHILG